MIVILVGRVYGVFILLSFFNAAGNAGHVVCPLVEVSIIKIVFLLEDVLLPSLVIKVKQEWASQRSHRWHCDRQIDAQLPFRLHRCLACVTTYNINVRWLGIGQSVHCVLCRSGLGKWDSDFVVVKLFALRLENLCRIQKCIGWKGKD